MTLGEILRERMVEGGAYEAARARYMSQSPGSHRGLVTEDLQDGQDLLGVTVVDPFRHAPEEILGA